MEIVIQNPIQATQPTKVITLEQYQKKRERRRRRVVLINILSPKKMKNNEYFRIIKRRFQYFRS